MRLREWQPATATDGELTAWLRAFNAMIAADIPGDPLWHPAMLREYLTITMPGERRLAWLAEGDAADAGGTSEADGTSADVLGFGRLLMATDLGVLELYVAPEARHRGVGRTVLATIADRAVAEGFGSLAVEVVGGTAAERFYQRNGFTVAYTEMRSILDLATVDWNQLAEMAAGVVAGYRIEHFVFELPDDLLPRYAEAKQARQLHLAGDLDLRPSSYDADRLRASLRCLRGRGLKPYIVVAVHERTHQVAGLTELVVPAQHPTRADQYDTTIVPEHNGYGLARTLKARMLLELRGAEPQLRDVQTWHSPDNEHLQQVNKELGFRADRVWREYEADAHRLVQRLSPHLPGGRQHS